MLLAGCVSHSSGSDPVPLDRCVTDLFSSTGGIDETSTQHFAGDQIVATDWEQPSQAGSLTNWSYQYDAQGRPVLSRSVHGGSTTDNTATYSATQIVVTLDTGTQTYVSDLQNGVVTHTEGPMEQPSNVRSVDDYTYDAMGRQLTHTSSAIVADVGTRATSTTAWTYDTQGRMATVTHSSDTSTSTTTLTYATTVDGWTVREEIPQGTAQIGTFAFDSQGRLVRSAIDEDGDAVDDWFATYTYDDATATIAVNDVRPATDSIGRTWQMQGRCASPTVQTAPAAVVPLSVPGVGLFVVNPGSNALAY